MEWNFFQHQEVVFSYCRSSIRHPLASPFDFGYTEYTNHFNYLSNTLGWLLSIRYVLESYHKYEYCAEKRNFIKKAENVIKAVDEVAVIPKPGHFLVLFGNSARIVFAK